ncbi:Factor arrest protein 11 [Lodderomyces elongisporus]|uniref:Factor arrest protein 11 n=1 Tax=Lodderomyces elongisporus TaxID=36914 RepID=UPI00291D2B65|nr:Factor arrest protein 11 [Lodderomyces elongisporus]WLF81453.1 Factor arrest protein 11 [Lodderomyces elongisporus]
MNYGPIQIDQLEDSIIDHPDAETRQELNDTSLDETFQKKLSAKAHEIEMANSGPKNNESNYNDNDMSYQFLVTKSHLSYEYKEIEDIEQAISEWFTYSDLKAVGVAAGVLASSKVFNNDIDKSLQELNQLNQSGLEDDLDCLKNILYFSFGLTNGSDPGDRVATKTAQIENIIHHNEYLISQKAYEPLINMVINFLDKRVKIDKQGGFEKSNLLSRKESGNYFKLLTLIYFMILVSLKEPGKSSIVFKKFLRESCFMEKILSFIVHWKWFPNNSYRTRYLILIFNKLIFFEFGDSEQIRQCDNYLNAKHNITKNKADIEDKTRLTCSPLDYFAFREDLLDKFPLFDANVGGQSRNSNSDGNSNDVHAFSSTSNQEELKSIEKQQQQFMSINAFSNSLASTLEIPRTNKSHSVLSQLPTQPVHLATPIPSPKLAASDYMTGGEKIRKSYQVNQSMPFIYPVDPNSKYSVPVAMIEADKILQNAVYESYSLKMLWKERDKFMQQERGYESAYGKDDNFDLEQSAVKPELKANTDANADTDANTDANSDHYEVDSKNVASLQRVEQFYASSLSKLHTFVKVLIEIIKSNRIETNLNFYELELNPSTSYMINSPVSQSNDNARSKIEMVLMSQLEVLSVKETTCKAVTDILLNLLSWLKRSHILKSYYFSSLLFDQQFFSIALDYIGGSFNNPNNQSTAPPKSDELIEYEVLINQNRLLNPQIKLPTMNFFNHCLGLRNKSYDYQFINKTFISELPKEIDENNINHVQIRNYNANFAHILSNLLRILNKVVIKNQSQRIFALNDLKPSELFKMILINYDTPAFSKPILKIMKKLVPYQGRKWKNVNMDLISSIYMNCKLSMKDSWLSGRDLESDFNTSYDQEVALRALLQFYNIRRYPSEMEKIGYKLNNDAENFDISDIPALNLESIDLSS